MDPPQPCLHRYEPLSVERQEIRIAIIEPAMDYSVPIRFTFHTALLEDLEGQYEALSYVWGKPILVYPVYHTRDGTRLLVTENLNHALRRLRYKADQRWLWADALCFHQTNDEEKSTQIPLMVNIYSGARRVVAWLHRADDTLERGMICTERWSRRIVGLRAQANLPDSDDGQSVASGVSALSHKAKTGYEEKLPPYLYVPDGKSMEDLVAFLTLPYFQRLWIIQEIVSNADVVLVCGEVELSWLRLNAVLSNFRDSVLRYGFERFGHRKIPVKETAQLWNRHYFHQGSPPKHIFQLVLQYSTYECTDPRDRIFAVHALSGHNNAHMTIDYTSDVPTTYRKFAVACMADGRTHDVLRAASLRVRFNSVEMPSWLPDWRMPINDNSFKRVDEAIDDERIPMVYFSGEPRTGHVQLFFRSFAKTTRRNMEREARYPLMVTQHRCVSMNQNMYHFISAVDDLYVKTSRPSTVHQQCLWSILRWLWEEGSSSLSDDHFSALLKCLWARRSGDKSYYDEQIANHEQLLTAPIATATKGYRFFEARFEDSDTTEFCYGSVNVRSGDILLPLVEERGLSPKSHKMYRMCVLSSLSYTGEHYETTRKECLWTDRTYRIVGEAWLAYPPEDARLTRKITSTFKVTLC